MKSVLMAAVLLGLGAGVGATAREVAVQYSPAKFTIDPLPGDLDAAHWMPFTMQMPPIDGFAPNVNVQIQAYKGTIDEYMTLSRSQFDTLGIEIVSERRDDPSTVTFEYKGNMQGRALMWYARAQKRGARVYLVTATSTPQAWPRVSAALKASVDSLRIQ